MPPDHVSRQRRRRSEQPSETGAPAPAPAGALRRSRGRPRRAAADAIRRSATLARYKDFTLVEARPTTPRARRRRAPCGATTCAACRSSAGASTRSPRRRAAQARRGARDSRPATARCSSSSSSSGRSRTTGSRGLKATGVAVVSYMAENAELVHAEGAARAALTSYVAAAPEVRGAFELRAADKIARRRSARGRCDVAVQTIAGDPGAARALAGRRARAIRRARRRASAPTRRMRMTIDADELAQLAADPGVVAIEPDRAPTPARRAPGAAARRRRPRPRPGAGYLAAYDSLLFAPSETPSTLPFIVDLTDSAIGNGTTTPTSADLRVDGSARGLEPDRLRPQAQLGGQRPGRRPGLRRPRHAQREHPRRQQRRLGRRHHRRRRLPLRPRDRAAGAHRRHDAVPLRRGVRLRRQDVPPDRRGRLPRPPARATPARASSTTRGAPLPAAPTTRRRRSTTRSCATRCRRRPARSRWSRSSRPVTTAPAPGTLEHPGDGEERHHGRRQRERARLRDRRVRHDATADANNASDIGDLLEPRADRRRPHQARPRRAGNAPQRPRLAGDRIAVRRQRHLRHRPQPMGVFFPGTAVLREQRHLARRAGGLRARGGGALGLPPRDRPVPVGGDGQGDADRRRRRRCPAAAPASRRASTRASAWRGSRAPRRPAAGSTTSPSSSRRAASRSRARST